MGITGSQASRRFVDICRRIPDIGLSSAQYVVRIFQRPQLCNSICGDTLKKSHTSAIFQDVGRPSLSLVRSLSTNARTMAIGRSNALTAKRHSQSHRTCRSTYAPTLGYVRIYARKRDAANRLLGQISLLGIWGCTGRNGIVWHRGIVC